MNVKEILKETEGKMKKSIDSVEREFSEVRTGRAHPGLIEGIHVDYFGTATPFKQLASISTPDPITTIAIPNSAVKVYPDARSILEILIPSLPWRFLSFIQ